MNRHSYSKMRVYICLCLRRSSCLLLLLFANPSSWQENCGINFCSYHICCTQPPSLHLSLGRSLEGILKHPGQILGNLQVKPCETPRDTQHTMYSWATLFISLPQVLQQRESTEYWSRNSLTVVTARVSYVVSGFFYFHPQCQGRRHLRFTWYASHEEHTS